MELLKQRIRAQGIALNSDVLKVDSFLNHQVDPELMLAIGVEFARAFAGSNATRVATIESSGIAPALMTAQALGLPLLIMKKQTSRILSGDLMQTEVTSFTKGKKYMLTASRAYIQPGERVLIIDDFLAYGEAALGACEIVRQAGAQVAGIGAVIEKAFQPGHDKLVNLGYKLVSLARIRRMSPGQIEFVDD